MARAKKTDVVEETLDNTEAQAEDTNKVAEAASEAPAEEAATEETALTESDPAVLVEDENGEVVNDEEDDTESSDSLTFSNGVIEKIVAIAVREVPGVLGMKGGFVNRIQETFGATVATKGVTVEVGDDNAMYVNISVIIEYGAYAPQVFEDVKQVVVEQVANMTGLEVGGVNLRIEDVLTADEYKRMQREDEESEGE